MTVTPDRWKEFLALVLDTRHAQQHYRQTLCPFTRAKVRALEDELDLVADQLTSELLPGPADEPPPPEANGHGRPAWMDAAETSVAAARQEGGAA